MKTRALLSLSLSALMLGGTMVGCAAGSGGIASASDRNAAVADQQAAAQAGRAQQSLAKRKPDAAVRFAEGAVALKPQDASYRVLLGQSYLKAGRFDSARAAFADALTLSPDSGAAALNLALAQTALGQWDVARHTLDAHVKIIPIADLGLAMALAGDPQTAVQVLTVAARSPDATAKTRQNLALALALAGRWHDARTLIGFDLSPADVDRRIMQWATFAQPGKASDQVASLLGVKPVSDAGQPVALALAAPAGPATAVVAVETPVGAPIAPTPVLVSQPVPDAPPPIRFARQEVVQPLPFVSASVVPRAARPMRAVRVAALPAKRAAMAPGAWYVQLGAYQNAAVAKDGWGRAQRRYAAFRGHVPAGMSVASHQGSFYRLSLGGFARTDAVGMCRSYRGKGGACFVRQGAGDRVAQWVAKGRPVQLASR